MQIHTCMQRVSTQNKSNVLFPSRVLTGPQSTQHRVSLILQQKSLESRPLTLRACTVTPEEVWIRPPSQLGLAAVAPVPESESNRPAWSWYGLVESFARFRNVPPALPSNPLLIRPSPPVAPVLLARLHPMPIQSARFSLIPVWRRAAIRSARGIVSDVCGVACKT